jgi:hypothetical protein
MRSSYLKEDLNYGDLIGNLTFALNPKKIIEIGILDGYSLEHFIKNSNSDTIIKAYDLFEDFVGNCAIKETVDAKFARYENVKITKGDFYELPYSVDNDIDIIHIDIANNGHVFEYAIKHYLPKLSENGVLILEGGSLERDDVEWMHKYNKPAIRPILEKYSDSLKIKTIGRFPSITFIKK